MPTVKFATGQSVNFANMPSPQDIQEVATKLGIDKPTTSQPQDSSFFGQSIPGKVGNFLTSGTQVFGKTIGESLAAPANADLYAQTLSNHQEVTHNLQDAIRKAKLNGGDTTKLENLLAQQNNSIPKIEDFTGQVINKTGEQVLGEGAMTGMEALSGGLLGGGAEALTSKTLSTGGKLLQGAKIGAAYGAIGGGANAMQQNSDVGGVIGGTALGGAIGGTLGAGLAGAGVLAGKAGAALNKTGIVNKLLPQTEERLAQQTSWVPTAEQKIAKVAEDVLPLTPTQKIKQAQMLARTGENDYTVAGKLAKYGFSLGDENAIPTLQKISDQFDTAINMAKSNEHGWFNLNTVKTEAVKSINENLTSATERLAAENKLNEEIANLLKEKGVTTHQVGNQTYIQADTLDRIRKTGNAWAEYNKLNPDTIKNSAGRALANASRTEAENSGTFPAYREAMKQWGQVIHLQQTLQTMEDSGKVFKGLGGIMQPLTRRLISGGIGMHLGGIPGLVLSELTTEYASKVLSNPDLRTYFERKLVQRFGGTTMTPEAAMKNGIIKELADQIKAKADETFNMSATRALPPPSALGVAETSNRVNPLALPPSRFGQVENPIITPAPTTFEKQAPSLLKKDNPPMGQIGNSNKLNAGIAATLPVAAVPAMKQMGKPGNLNNPGNLVFMGQEGATKGAKRPDGTYWASFSTPEAGFKAMGNDINIKLKKSPNMTLRDLVTTRSPASDGNNIHNILYNISDELFDIKGKDGKIINGKSKVKDIPLDRLTRAIAKSEGYK